MFVLAQITMNYLMFELFLMKNVWIIFVLALKLVPDCSNWDHVD